MQDATQRNEGHVATAWPAGKGRNLFNKETRVSSIISCSVHDIGKEEIFAQENNYFASARLKMRSPFYAADCGHKASFLSATYLHIPMRYGRHAIAK
jgi:hypothetical protein